MPLHRPSSSASPPHLRARPLLKLLLLCIAGVFGLGFLALLAAGWYYADQIRAGALEPERGGPSFDLRVAWLDHEQLELVPISGGASSAWQKDGIWGTPEGVIDRLRRHIALGCTTFVIEFFGRDTRVPARLFAEKVLPAFR